MTSCAGNTAGDGVCRLGIAAESGQNPVLLDVIADGRFHLDEFSGLISKF
jgi:hypothetical protein